METICLQCGDKGFTNAFVYCVKCLNFAVHRYCLHVIPETFDELVHWVCGDDCEGDAQNQSSMNNRDIIPSNTRDLIVVRKDEHVPTNVDSVDYDETIKDRAINVLHSEDEREICPSSLTNQIDKGAKEEEDKLTQPVRLIIKGIPKKIKKKKRLKTKSSKKKKDKHTPLDDVPKEEVQVKDDKISKQRDGKCDSSKSSKSKTKEELVIPSEDNLLEDKSEDVSKLFDEETKEKEVQVKDDKISKKRDRNHVSSKSSKKKKKRKLVIPSEENLLEDKPENKKNSEENKCSLSKDNVKNGVLEDKNEKIIEDIPKNLHISNAEPVAMPIWTGGFDILKEGRVKLTGILAHVSISACVKVYDEALQFRPVLQLQMLPKSDVWPKSFETLEPRGDNIALYFFPSKSSEQDFDRLVDKMMNNELALKATLQNAELLIFNSSELPLIYWKFQGKYYLWGVFRQKQSSPSNSHPFRDEAKDKNPIKPNGKDKTSLTKTGHNGLSPRSTLCNSASNGSRK
ncbi:hypothetical protein CASFOL_016107 [Castilleja foliolosa]|uniref:AIPP2-like SPOC-like domain-containing protein n=1 Tax=Castilleja foliolosa TaxID=1961234 RepID=A0ABD3DJE4_9LAMI